MYQLFLTQGGGILGPIERLLGWILNLMYEFLSIFGIENVGLSIIFFTIIVKTLMLPLTIRQQRFSKVSSKMNPEISKIQEKYKEKKDEASMQKQQVELQAVYDKYGSNPTSGCLPMLVTLPIMMGLYRVIYKIPAYIKPIKEIYEVIAESINGIEGSTATLLAYGEELGVRVGDFAAEGILSLNHTVDIMSKFTVETWQSIADDFPSIAATIQTNADEIIRINSIPGGINLLESPGFAFPGILIPILAASLQFVQTRQTVATTGAGSDAAASSMNTMNKVMPIMSGVFCTMLPSGVGLYWVANSLITIIQNLFINKHMETVDLDEMIEKNKEKQKKKQAKIGINQGQSFSNIAKTSTKSIDSDSETDDINSSTDKISNNTLYKSGNISDYANYIKNKDKGDK